MTQLRSRRLLFLLSCAGLLNGAIWRSPSVNEQGQVCATPGACVYTITCNGAPGSRTGVVSEIQTALNSAQRGDTIKLEAGCKWSSSAQNAITLRNPPGSSGMLTITTTEDDKLPNAGTRITKAYLPLMPHIVLTGGTGPFFFLPGEFSSPNGQAVSNVAFVGVAFLMDSVNDVSRGAIQIGQFGLWRQGNGLTSLNVSGGIATVVTGAAHSLMTGATVGIRQASVPELNVVAPITVTNANTFTLATPGVPDGSYVTNAIHVVSPPTPNQLPTNIVLDRIVTTQTLWDKVIRRTLLINGGAVTVRDSFLEGVQHDGTDSQTISSVYGGPFLIHNNYVGSATENIMFGGDYNPTQTPNTGTIIQFNYLPNEPQRYWALKWDILLQPGIGKGGEVHMGRMVLPSTGSVPYYIALDTGFIASNTPEPEWCQTANCITEVPKLGGGTIRFRRRNNAQWIMKNNFETKGAKDTLIRHNVFDYKWRSNQTSSLNLKAENQKPFPFWGGGCIPTTIGVVNVGGANNTIVTRVSGQIPFQVIPAGNTPDGLTAWQVRINGTVYGVSSFDTADQFTLAAGPATPLTNANLHYGSPTDNPCDADWNWGTTIEHNIVRNTLRPFSFTPGVNSRRDQAYGLTIRHNLFHKIDMGYWVDTWGNPLTTTAASRNNFTGTMFDGITIENNTWDVDSYVNAAFYLGDEPGGTGAVMRYNIMPGAASGLNPRTARTYGINTGNWNNYQAVWRDVCDMPGGPTYPGTPCPTSRWDQNVIAGADIRSYSAAPGQVWNLCGSLLPFLAGCTLQNVNWDLLYQDRARGNFRVRNEATALKRLSARGQDIGADISQLPQIRDLVVKPTDRMALFTWRVTEPISAVPCVIEVNESPDQNPTRYAGELSQMGAWHRYDADDHDRNARNGLTRMVVIGHTANLAAEQQYYYRLQCGGDTTIGSFRTEMAQTEASQRIIAHTMRDTAAATLEVVYGTTYSRTADQITNGGAVNSSCTVGRTCSVSFPVPAGVIAYYRWIEKNAVGQVVRTGTVQAVDGLEDE
jgi:hypothetical protein